VLDDLVTELRDAVARAGRGDRVVAIHLFGIRHAARLDGNNLHDLADRAGIGRSFGTELRKGVRLAEHVRLK
jgi:5-methylcytosine-specific restriction protein B